MPQPAPAMWNTGIVTSVTSSAFQRFQSGTFCFGLVRLRGSCG